jgi:uncharacterized membrane protein
MAWYAWIKWLHVLGAIIALGANLTYPIWDTQARKDPKSTKFMLGGITALEKWAGVGYATLVLSGVAMILLAGYAWTTPWIISSLGLFVVVGFIAGRFYSPALRAQAALADKPESAEYEAAEVRSAKIGILVILLVVLIELLMTVKPALWG